ncbi:MAG: acetoacetate decarboxylase family protein [Polyangiaceae bacterium]|nr:acetoacetate decarboxylase family protein [Polyangiaceae bacterium]
MGGPGAPYVELGGEPLSRQPYAARGARLHGFVFDADESALARLLDRHLNAPRGMGHPPDPRRWGADRLAFARFVPLAPAVLLLAADLPDLSSLDPAEGLDRGRVSEIDIGFWVPFAIVRGLGPLRFVEGVGFFVPHLFVDDGWALTAGREVDGLHKLIAQNRLPRSEGDEGLFSVDTVVLDRFGPDERARPERLVELRRSGNKARGPLRDEWPSWGRARDEFLRRLLPGGDGHVTLPGLGLAVQALEAFARSEGRIVTLKQFRDVADPTRACYQAICELPARVGAFRGAGALGGQYSLTLRPTASHPLAEELGLRERQSARAALWMDLDFTLQAGKVLWQA